jgi:hypothetical protein
MIELRTDTGKISINRSIILAFREKRDGTTIYVKDVGMIGVLDSYQDVKKHFEKSTYPKPNPKPSQPPIGRV